MQIDKKHRHKKQTGYTLIEVMFALVIFMTSVMGLVSLHAFSSQGVGEAKDQTMAVNIASFFLTQLQNEISGWPGPENLDGTLTLPDDFPTSRFPLLRVAYGAVDAWHNLGDDDFRVGDYLGHKDLADSDITSRFCVNFMISPMEARRTGAVNDDGCRVWKIRVRVSRTRPGQFVTDWNLCTPAEVDVRIASKSEAVVELVGVATREYAK